MADFSEVEALCCQQLGGIETDIDGMDDTVCYGINNSLGVQNIWTANPCETLSNNSTAEAEEDSGWNWTGISGLLETLGAIAVPFLPFLFGSGSTTPSGGGTDNLDEYKNDYGKVIIIGFVILIALSVGAYIYIKKRR